MPPLAYADLTFSLRVHGPAPDLPFLGPTVRGLLGYGLRQTCCGHDADERGACSLGDSCTYAYLFEGPVQLRSRRRGLELDALPQPFLPLVAPPGRADRGADPQRVRFGIRLIGHASDLAPAVVDAIVARERHGFGARSHAFTVESARIERSPGPWTEVPRAHPASDHGESDALRRLPRGVARMRFRFDAPIALGVPRGARAPRHLLAQDCIERPARALLGAAMVDAMARRLWLLEHAYGHSSATIRSIPRAEDPAQFATRDLSLQPFAVDRRSTRHGRTVHLEGSVGHATIEGPWSRLTPLLAAARDFGIGRHITFGFGRVSLELPGAGRARDAVLSAEGAPPPSAGKADASVQPTRSSARAEIRRPPRAPRWVRLRGAPPIDNDRSGPTTT